MCACYKQCTVSPISVRKKNERRVQRFVFLSLVLCQSGRQPILTRTPYETTAERLAYLRLVVLPLLVWTDVLQHAP